MQNNGVVTRRRQRLWKVFAKLLSVGVSASLMLAMVPQNSAFAEEPEKFVTSAKGNHWGRSNLRAYLNGVEKTGQSPLPLDTSEHEHKESGYYESQLSDTEYNLVQPFTYSTNVLNGNRKATAVYETTDKFWLPSGNDNSDQVMSWGAEDISADAQYDKSTVNDLARVIPISYWSYGAPPNSMLRSPNYIDGGYALEASRSNYIHGSSVNTASAFAPAFKINLSSVIFASAASAASIADDNESDAKKIPIRGSKDFGKKSSSALPDYGMYLKTASNDSFTPDALTYDYSAKTLTVNYSGGTANQYMVVHAFKADNLIAGTESYAAAQKLEDNQASVTIDVSAWKLSSLDGYTIKVWMENDFGSLAKATTPVTFVGTNKTDSGAAMNTRVFAMKPELQCSWGTLNNATDLVGRNPTNQKIYFGSKDDAGQEPLEFWIAGRENAAVGGTIDPAGQVMTLYQAKSVETKQFNASSDNYNVTDKPAVTLQLAEGQSMYCTGSAAEYPWGSITFKVGDSEQAKSSLKWQYRTPGTTTWIDGMPSNSGTYELRCYAQGTENYERTHSNVVRFNVSQAIPTADDFEFTVPSNLTYDGTEKTAKVTAKSGITGMGEITAIKYYGASGTYLGDNVKPTAAGPYTVKIDVAMGDNYTAASDLEVGTFTIGQATPDYTIPTGLTAVYGQTLSEITLLDGWTWTDPDSTVGNVGAQSHSARFTPTDADNYETVTRDLTITVAKATPQYEVPTGLTATYGQTLSEVSLPSGWVWDKPTDLVGNVGTQSHSATFTPTDPNYSSVQETLSIYVTSDTPDWGDETDIEGISHWIAADGTTSVKITEKGIICLKEESGGSSVWYGIDNSDGVFEIGSRFWVRWLNRDSDPVEFANLWEQLDAEHKNSIDGDNAWLFEIGVTAPDGTPYTKLSHQVPAYVQIGNDWDKTDLQGCYVSVAQDESVRTTFVDDQKFPEGYDTFGLMHLSHFSPYFIYDKLTDEEKAALEQAHGDLTDEEKDELEQAHGNLSDKEKLQQENTSNQVKTGDQVSLLTILGLILVMLLALASMLNVNSIKRKFRK